MSLLENPPPHLILYDSECGLCDKSIQFILKRDKKALFCFAPLTGETAEKLGREMNFSPKISTTLILIENFQTDQRKTFTESKAVFKILKKLGGIWAGFGLGYFLPGFLFNPIYRWIAKRRHCWFKNNCYTPNNNEKARFLK